MKQAYKVIPSHMLATFLPLLATELRIDMVLAPFSTSKPSKNASKQALPAMTLAPAKLHSLTA